MSFPKARMKMVHLEGGHEDFYSRSTFNFPDIVENTTFLGSLGNDPTHTFIDFQYSQTVED